MMLNVAVVGIGYWGPNLVRNFASLEDVRVLAICDKDEEKAKRIRQRLCPDASVFGNYMDLVNNLNIDAVVIATPFRTHFELCKFFLNSGRHVFCEKPLAQSVEECQSLIDLSEKRQRVLMVGHIFEYNMAVQKIKKYIDQGDLGKLFYVYSQRVNLGRIQTDVNALWSFAPHDVSIINYWIGQEPVRVAARGFSCLNGEVEDVVFVTLEYPQGIGAHLHLGWLDPRKIRLMTVVGSKKMLVYDDVSLDEKIKIFDKGIANLDDFLRAPESFAEFQFQIRVGDAVTPTLKFSEPLRSECQHFVDCIRSGEQVLTDGLNGLRVVKVLEAAQRSLRLGGETIGLREPERLAKCG